MINDYSFHQQAFLPDNGSWVMKKVTFASFFASTARKNEF